MCDSGIAFLQGLVISDHHRLTCPLISVARLVLDPTTTQYLQEGNPGDPQDSVEVCITAEADEALSLDRSIDVYIMLGGTAGNPCVMNM